MRTLPRAARTAAPLTAAPPFRFSRLGPKGGTPGEALDEGRRGDDQRAGRVRTSRRGSPTSASSSTTTSPSTDEPPDGRRHRAGGRPDPGALAEPRPRLALRPRPATLSRRSSTRPTRLHLKTGTDGEAASRRDGIADKPHPGFDLPRRSNRKALIPDPRNDENLAVAQTHIAFIRFHNRVVDRCRPTASPRPSSSNGRARPSSGTTSG